MTLLNKITTVLFICFNTALFAQMQDYSFQRELSGIEHEWHSVSIPSEMFSHLKQDLSDVRIYGVSEEKDTIEAPYILRINRPTIDQTSVVFKLINESKTENGYFYTFEINDKAKVAINSIKLDFDRTNFDWRVNVEGSQNQNEWFTIKEDYRILSINNKQTDYKYTTLTFPDSKYTYYRVKINSKENPRFNKATIKQIQKNEGTIINHPISSFTTEENNTKKQTISHIKLSNPAPLSELKFNIGTTQDYYRNMSIEHLVDSVKTDKGYKYNYHKLGSGTLNSIDNNSFELNSKIVQNIKVIIENNDNAPLTITSIEAKGYKYQLIARFSKPAKYYLTYSNINASSPNYDIARFQENIPEQLTPLTTGNQLIIDRKNVEKQSPLFENEKWLWAIMIVVVLVLGLFTYKMFSGAKGE